MPFFRSTALAVIFCTLATTAFAAPAVQDIDPSVKPGDDFYRYANGNWLKTANVPAGLTTYDTRAMINALTRQRVRDLIQGAATAKAPSGTPQQKVGDYYAAFVDQDSIEAKGLTPLAADMAAIAAISDTKSLSAYLGGTLNSEVDGVTANGDHVLGLLVNQGYEDGAHNYPHLLQGGLGMPDRESYLSASPEAATLRTQYQAHIAAVLKLAGLPDADARAGRVLALEIKLAQSHAPDSDAADVFKQNNPWHRADFATKAPGMDWEAWFTAASLDHQQNFTIWQPTAVTGLAALVGGENVDTWKDYLRVHLIDHYAAVLPRAVQAEHFAFYGTVLNGATQMPDRGEDAIAATNGAVGQAVGQLYTQAYFPPAAKAAANDMAANILTAYRGRIENLTWMSPATRAKALTKLAAFKVGLGYPDTWLDYGALDVARDDAFGNLRRAEAFNRQRNLTRLTQPADPMEWPIHPQTVGAIIMFSPNSEFFAATLLQPPFFDPEGDAASNYGSAGAGMAHEFSHSFDELGNIYDDQGRLGAWWTPQDTANYHATAAKLVTQVDHDCPLPDLCLNGTQTLGENIADLAGLRTAHDAYLLSLHGKPDVVIGGLTGEQRFYLAFAQRWRRLQDETALRRQVKTDTHLPGEYRSDAVRNDDAWYKAFGIKPGDRLYLPPEDRVGIW